MKRLLLLTSLGAFVFALAAVDSRSPAAAQLLDLSLNPDIIFPPDRANDNANLSVREARQRVYEALALEAEGNAEAAMDKWRDAWGRYDNLHRTFLKPDMPASAEILVKGEHQPMTQRQFQEQVFTEKWVPLADHINETMRGFEWPRALRERWSMRQQAPGAEMLQSALARQDAALLRRCARFYQFSDAGRTALQLLAQNALEAGDSLLARRWLDDLRAAWPDYFNRDPMLNLMLVRACRDTDGRLALDTTLRRIERNGLDGQVDVGGVSRPLRDSLEDVRNNPAPAERPELRAPGWLTMQGDFNRNAIAPPVSAITGVVPIGADEKEKGYKVGVVVARQENNDYPYRSSDDRPAVPILFPTVHEAGVFLHRPQVAGQETPEQLLWFRHGREATPVQLEVPQRRRYTRANRGSGGGGWWRSSSIEPPPRFRTLGSTIGRLQWPLDGRESDVLFAVMGLSNPQPDRPNEPTGNQIQAWNLSDDGSLRVTMPNRESESAQEFNFLKHVTFMGAPIVHDNRLYIAGAIPESSSVEYWAFCFDVTPKGDPGEGRLLWRTHLCSWANKGGQWGRQATVTINDMSSMSMQGGMLYVATHNGASAGLDRATGELCWVARNRRLVAQVKGWFNNAPVAACGYMLNAPTDSGSSSGSEVALVHDGPGGTHMFEQPHRGIGLKGEYEYVLGVLDNCMIIQGRNRLHCVSLSSFRRDGRYVETDWARLVYQSAQYGQPAGRGVIAGNNVLVPLRDKIAIFDARNGKLISEYRLDGINMEGGPVTLTVYCRGEAYKDEDGLQRYRPATVTEPQTGNVYSVEHLADGSEFRFPSGAVTTVKKETLVVMASSAWVYLFTASDS